MTALTNRTPTPTNSHGAVEAPHPRCMFDRLWLDNVNDLGADEEWKFEVLYTTWGRTREVASYEIAAGTNLWPLMGDDFTAVKSTPEMVSDSRFVNESSSATMARYGSSPNLVRGRPFSFPFHCLERKRAILSASLWGDSRVGEPRRVTENQKRASSASGVMAVPSRCESPRGRDFPWSLHRITGDSVPEGVECVVFCR